MSTRKWLLSLIILTSTAAVAATGGGQFQLPAWTSSPRESSNPDTAYGFSKFNNLPGRYDRNADGRVDLIIADRDGDGQGDYWSTDRNFDGLIDDYQYDRNFDGNIDQWEYDLDYDGVSDRIYVDANGDGKPDLHAELNAFTKSYTWYGDMKGIQGSRKVQFPTLQTTYGHAGRVGDSR